MKNLQGICFTCLSTDRQLFSLLDVRRQFPYPINIDFIIKSWVLDQQTQVCWECKAVLMRISHFTGQAVAAQRALKQLYDNLATSPTPLSNLKILPTFIMTADSLYENDLPKDQLNATENDLPKDQLNTTENGLPEDQLNTTENDLPTDQLNTMENDLLENQLDSMENPITNEAITTVDIIKNETDIKVEMDIETGNDIIYFPSAQQTSLDPVQNVIKNTYENMIQSDMVVDKIDPLYEENKVYISSSVISEVSLNKQNQVIASQNDVKTYVSNIPEFNVKSVKNNYLTQLKITNVTSGATCTSKFQPKIGMSKKIGPKQFQHNRKIGPRKVLVKLNEKAQHKVSEMVKTNLGEGSSNKDSINNYACTSRTRVTDSEETESENEIICTDKHNESSVESEILKTKVEMGRTYKLYDKPDAVDAFTVTRVSYEEMMRFREQRKEKWIFQRARLKCLQCLSCFNSETSLKKHNMLHERKGDFKCEVCGIVFCTQSELQCHMDGHTWYYKCCSCDFGSLWLKSITNHVKCHHTIYPVHCHKCGATFLTPNELKKHMFSAHYSIRRPSSCEQCGKTFSYPSALKRHVKSQHSKDYVKPMMVKCPHCDKMLSSKYACHFHVQRIHNNAGRDPAYCAQCNKFYKDRMALEIHLKTSQAHVTKDNYKFECEICRTKFPTITSIRGHIKRKHSNRKKIQCDLCSMKFSYNRSLKAHKARKHGGDALPKDKICDYCGKVFAEKNALKDHINTHTGARPYDCGYCGAKFGFKDALWTHIHLKHKNDKNTTLNKNTSS